MVAACRRTATVRHLRPPQVPVRTPDDRSSDRSRPRHRSVVDGCDTARTTHSDSGGRALRACLGNVGHHARDREPTRLRVVSAIGVQRRMHGFGDAYRRADGFGRERRCVRDRLRAVDPRLSRSHRRRSFESDLFSRRQPCHRRGKRSRTRLGRRRPSVVRQHGVLGAVPHRRRIAFSDRVAARFFDRTRPTGLLPPQRHGVGRDRTALRHGARRDRNARRLARMRAGQRHSVRSRTRHRIARSIDAAFADIASRCRLDCA